ncbi:Uncharacterized protein APZ42_019386, partial [Daphnia magna]
TGCCPYLVYLRNGPTGVSSSWQTTARMVSTLNSRKQKYINVYVDPCLLNVQTNEMKNYLFLIKRK